MDDLVRRLRNVDPEGMVDHKWRLIYDAADRIEALEAKLATAGKELLAAAEDLEGYVGNGYGDKYREVVSNITDTKT